MPISKQVMKKEAVARMESLKIHSNVVIIFAENDILNLSFNGFLHYLSDEQKERVEKFEKEHNSLVYHVIQNFTSLGEMLTFLYVSPYPEEWAQDRRDIKAGYPIAYVVNVDDDCLSEFGSVHVQPCDGGVIRTV